MKGLTIPGSRAAHRVAMLALLSGLVYLVDARADSSARSGSAPPPSAATTAKSMSDLANETFAARCAKCHAVVGNDGFRRLTPAEVYAVLRRGQMQEPATGLDDGVLHALAETFGNPQAARARPINGGAVSCVSERGESADRGSWSGFSAEPTHVRFVPQPLSQGAIQGARLRWAFSFPTMGFERGADNPVAVAHGQVYVGNLNHWMYALDLESGCARWAFEAETGIRSGATVENGVVAFGDMRGNVYAVDEQSGALRWRQVADTQSFARITGTPQAHQGRLVVPVSFLQEILGAEPQVSCCTARGSAVSFDLRSGRVDWRTYMIERPLEYLGKSAAGVNQFGPSGAVVFAPPTIDAARGAVYISTGNQTSGPQVAEADAIVALDFRSGERRWVRTLVPEGAAQDLYTFACEDWLNPTLEGCPAGTNGVHEHGDRDIAAPTTLVRRADGQDVLIAGSKSGMLYALDPGAQGRILWKLRLGEGGELGGIQYGMASDGTRVYVPIADADIARNVARGSLNAVDLVTGKLLWHTALPHDSCKRLKNLHCLAAIVSPPVVVGESVIVGAMDGVLRAYDAQTGRVFWSYDAARLYKGANGLEGTGGGFGMGGVTIVGNWMFVASGVNTGVVGSQAASGVLLAFQFGTEGILGTNPRHRH